MTQPTRTEPTSTAAEAARLARSASMVVAGRPPRGVRGRSGVATLGIAVDDYATVKLSGALAAFGQAGVVAAADLADAPQLAERLLGRPSRDPRARQVIAAERRAEWRT